MKIIKLMILLSFTSCSPFLLTGNEVFTDMYVRDNTGCSLKKAVVSTNKLNFIGVYDLAFYLETDNHKIEIPHMEMNYGHQNYIGVGTDGKKYTVTYNIEYKNTIIRVDRPGAHIIVSTKDICKSKY